MANETDTQNKQPSVFHILECDGGGVVKYAQMLTPRFRSAGIRQQIVCHEHAVDSFVKEGLIAFPSNMERTLSPISILRIIRQLRRKIKESKCDIVYCHSSFAGVFGRLAAWGLKRKVIYNPHGWSFKIHSTAKVVRTMTIFVEKCLASLTDVIVCVSNSEKDDAIKHHICNPKKLQVIENGIDIVRVQKSDPADRLTLGFSDDDYVVGMVGRISEQKAPDTFIHAAKLIKEVIPNAVFLIVGDGEDRKKIEVYAKDNNLKLSITGWVDNPYSFMKIMNAALLLSRWEGLPLVLPEFMAASVNVVATKIDSIAPLIYDHKNGLLVDIDSPSQVRDMVLWLHDNPADAEIIKNEAINGLDKFDISRVCEQHITLFHNLLHSQSHIKANS